jgi:hypothetical protein
MALNFPITPADGDTYQGYVYDATAGVWNSDPHQIASRFVTSATAPSSPSEGDGWFDTNTAKSYVYYDGVWVQLGALGTVDLNQIADVNVSSPANGESLVYDGTDWVNQNVSVDVYDVSTDSTGKFALPSGTTEERPESPNAGDIRFNSETGEPEWYSSDNSRWVSFRQPPSLEIQYLVVAGGGGGGGASARGAGGAGGYRSSIFGELSGDSSVSESAISLSTNTEYAVEVGAGGANGGGTDVGGFNGSDSVFHTITSLGGGWGGGGSTGAEKNPGGSGGSGGGSNYGGAGGAGTLNQGNNGGVGSTVASTYGGGGGGGASESGTNGTGTNGGNGGNGLSSSVTGQLITRAGGGAGGTYNGSGAGSPGAGGGGSVGQAGTANTGGGGGGCPNINQQGGAGGSGIVIIKYPSSLTISSSIGLTESTSTIGDYKVTQITAGTGTVTFS